jgi:surfactin synthase thioesterase subunit
MSVALVCLPFAGGGASFFRAWRDLPVDGLTVVPIQLPGREERFAEEPYRDAIDAAAHLAPQVATATAGHDRIALLGHSLGAVLAFEIARRLETTGDARLRHLFVSGSPGPWTGRDERATGLSDDEFVAKVQEFAGYRHEALADPDMREILLPSLRADVEMHENYKPVDERALRVPITSLRGDQDALVTQEQAEQWATVTAGGHRHVEVPGGHMYLTEPATPFLQRLRDLLG